MVHTKKSVVEEITQFSKRFDVPYKTRRQLISYFAGLADMESAVPRRDLFASLS